MQVATHLTVANPNLCIGSVACGILANPQRFGNKKIGFLSTYNKPLSAYLKAVSQLTDKEAVLESAAASASNIGLVCPAAMMEECVALDAELCSRLQRALQVTNLDGNLALQEAQILQWRHEQHGLLIWTLTNSDPCQPRVLL